MGMPLGLYLSVPFCRTKCTYCNFASDVFSRAVFERYLDRVCADIHTTPESAGQMGARLERDADSVYLGGGTPTILDSHQLERLFVTVRQNFRLVPETEITVECAPGTLTPAVVETLLRCGVNRVSLGVQSFVDREAASVGRLHKRETVLDDIVRLRGAGITQYEISNFARGGFESRHNLKYWTREPYVGFGVDAHSMLKSANEEFAAVRFATADALEAYVAGASVQRTEVSRQAALEETFFLGLRLTRGVDLE